MRKLLLIFICFLTTTLSVKSQTGTQHSKNKYFVTMYNLTEKNFDSTKDFLGRFTDATSIEFNKADSVFVISTFLNVNKQMVFGKMLKNYLPIKYMILEGEAVDPFPIYINNGNPEQDAIEYEKQKMDWIRKYPAEYKKLKSNK